MFRPRLVDVMHARQHLDDARTRAADLEQKITEADRLIAQRDAQVQSAEHLLALATDRLGGLPEQKCLAISGTTRDGRSYRGMRCATDPRVSALTTNLGTARGNRDAALALLAAARHERALFDRTDTQQQLIEAQSAYHESVRNSQLHSFTAMMFGKEPSEVSDGEIHRFLRIFVFVPAICTALAATLVAMSAVTKLKREPEQSVQLDGRAGEYILGPLAQQILREATDRTVSALHASVAPPPPRPTRAPFIVPERSVS